MRIIKPKLLQRGDVIGICAPASGANSEEALAKGIRYLEQLGYRIEIGKNVHHRRGYLAGTDLERASDFNRLASNPGVKAIFTVRGGYGSHRILPLVDYGVLKRNPKILVGYSDITALQLALLAKIGLVTFSGPMVVSNMAGHLRGESEEIFWRALTSPSPLPPLPCSREDFSDSPPRHFSNGRLIGGNLSIVSALVGTPYFPRLADPVLLMEEIDEKPYRIDRMLRQLRLAGLIGKSKGAVLGKFIGCRPEKGKPSLTLRQVFSDSFSEYRHPILSGLNYGHVKNPITIPIGLRVRLDMKSPRISFLEASVVP